MRRKEIKLAHMPDGRYRTLVVRNSTRPAPNDILTRAEVDDMIELGLFEVVIVEFKKQENA